MIMITVREEQRRNSMLNVLFGIFIVLHGLVHLWYVVLSFGLVEFQPDMGWTGKSWLPTDLLGESAAHSLAGILYITATILFIASSVGIFTGAQWWRLILMGSAIFSSVLILLYWDGGMEMIVEKGLMGLLINVVIIALITVFK